MSTAHIAPHPSPSYSYAVGGSFGELKMGGRPGRAGGGGLRSEITEFSRASRRRLMRLLNSINRDEVALPYFLTLTYHHTWPKDRQGRKKHLDALRKRMERKYGQFGAVWRLEFQRRGAPHYHLLLFVSPSAVIPRGTMALREHRRAALFRLRNNISWWWHEVVDQEDVELLAAGVSVEEVRSWRGVNSYAAKYMGKLETLQEGAGSVGRYWGTWRRELLPISHATSSLTIFQAIQLRRVLRKFSRIRPRSHRGDMQGFSCFVAASTSSRLLRWLGYYAQAPPDAGAPERAQRSEHAKPHRRDAGTCPEIPEPPSSWGEVRT